MGGGGPIGGPIVISKDVKVKPFVYVIAIVSAISGLLFGYDIGGSGESRYSSCS